MTLFGLSMLFGHSKLSSLESQVLDAVSAELSPSGREVFNKQLKLVNLIQRHGDGKEVNLYVMRRGKPFIEKRLLFPLMSEAQLATVEFLAIEGKKTFKADVWLANGRVFSIEFNKPPQEILEQGASVANVKLLRDPMSVASEATSSDARTHNDALAAIQSKLPDQYLQLVDNGKGVSINEWAVCAVQDVRKISQRDANYYLLAEKEDMGAVGVKEGDFSGQLYYLDYADDRGEKITVSLRKFLEEFDGGKVVGRF